MTVRMAVFVFSALVALLMTGSTLPAAELA